ncbi:MAG TPA: penicillin acylase family protein [Bryobacteraceae bacterium]
MLFHTRPLRAINLSIAVLLGLLLAAVYWFAWRSLPETSGTLAAPVSGKATVARDARGVPHISAESWQDAVFLQGYVTAQDRMWQMDGLRRLAAGELAEVVGKAGLESDRESRRWRMARIAEAQERNLTPESRAVLAAYARGVNFYLETHRGRLAPEFVLLNYEPRPWRVRDSLLAFLEMNRRLTQTWREEVNKFQMLTAGDAAKVNFLYPRGMGSEVQPGSNAWVVSGARSATGKPILANDPHLEWGVPSTWYLVHLRAPDLDVTGASLPGVPAVIIGHNRHIAWGVTNLGFDVQDLYREQLDLQSGRYVFQGRPEQARLEREAIAIKGQASEETSIWVTRHGPVFFIEGNQAYSMRWAPAEESSFDFPLLDVNRARNWDEFNAALARLSGPGQNAVYADDAGNIGYHAIGHLPIRGADCEPDVPMDGASGECEWQGFLPYEQLPQAFNPASGMIVTANQNPFPKDFPAPVDGRFGANYRAKQIRAALESKAQWTAEGMLTIQKDVYSPFSLFLAQQVVAAWDKHPGSNPQLQGAVDALRQFNGQMEKGTAAPLVAQLVYEELRNAVAERASPGHARNYETAYPAPEVVERLLRERPADWFADYDALLIKSLTGAVAEGEKTQGSKVSRWDYGQFNLLSVQHPILSQVPGVGAYLGKYFGIGPVAMSGSSTTIKQTTRRLGPSLRMVVDFSDFDKSLANLTTGESGHELSRHYMDQWDAYYVGKSFPMEYDKVDAPNVLTVSPLR